MARKITTSDGRRSAECTERLRHLECSVQKSNGGSPIHVEKSCDWIRYPTLIVGKEREFFKKAIKGGKEAILENKDALPCNVERSGKRKWSVTPLNDDDLSKAACESIDITLNKVRVPVFGTRTRRDCTTRSYPSSEWNDDDKKFFNEHVLPKTKKKWLWSKL